jgi:Flp pilus assembly protein TadD
MEPKMKKTTLILSAKMSKIKFFKILIFLILISVATDNWSQSIEESLVNLDEMFALLILVEGILSDEELRTTVEEMVTVFDEGNESVARLYLAVSDSFLKQKRLGYLIWMYTKVNQPDKATRYVEQLARESQGTEFGQTAEEWIEHGTEYYIRGNYARAIECFLEVKEIYEKTLGKEHPDYATTLNNLGTLYDSMGNYGKAEVYHLEAAGILETVLGKGHPDYATSLNNLGTLYWNMGDYGKAEGYLLEAATIQETSLGKGHPSYATSLNNLGALYISMGDYGKTEGYLLQAADIMETALGKGHPSYATSLNSLGALYDRIGDYGKAEGYYLEAATILETALGKGHPDYATSLNNLGALYNRMGDYGKAEGFYLKATGILETALGKGHPDYARSLNNLGALYISMGDYGKAEGYHLEAAGIWETALGKGHPYYNTSLNNLYMLYLSTNNYTQALVSKKEADLLNTIAINQNFSFLSEQQRTAYWNANSYTFELSYSLSFFHPVQESNTLNYDNALLSKGILLRATNAVRDSIYSSGDIALIVQFEKLGQFRQQISALRQRGGNEAYIQTLEAEAEALDKSLTQASAEFREFQNDLNLNWQNVRDSLQPNEAAIEFVSFELYDKKWTGKTQYAALVLRHGMDAPVWVPLCEETVLAGLYEKLDALKTNWEGRPQDLAKALTDLLYDELGHNLYTAVWQPLESVLGGVTAVYYSPSGLLHKVSFNAVPVNENLRLTDKYDLNLVSSTREVVYLKNKTAETPRSAVVYGGLRYDIDENTMRNEALAYNVLETETRISAALSADLSRGGRGGWGYLMGTDREQLAIQRMLAANGVPPIVYSGAGGNEESFKALNGGGTSVIHLATHGFFIEDIEKSNDDRELLQRVGGGQKALENPLLRSGLILAGGNHAWANNPVAGVEDGILFADEVARMNLLGTELVVLSACETGLGGVNNSEGVFGLQRAFKLAGAKTIVMSLWEVDDRATVMLMEQFYRNWLSGKSKQEAMKEAQKSLRADERFTSPYYWAAFVLMD